MTIQHLADPESEYLAALGLPRLISALGDVLASIDERIGFLEKRADIGRLPVPRDGIDEAEAERYFASYTLGPERDPSGTERDRSGTERRAS